MHNPSLVWLTIEATLLLCEQYAIPSKGHTEPLIARDSSGGYEVYVLVPPEEAGKSPGAIIGNAAARWLPLLEKGATHLHLVTLAGCAAGALQSALSQFVPASHEDAVSELAQLDARIAADGTGAMRVQLAHRRAELAAASAVAPMPAFPWLSNKVVGVQV
ncbi:hypothetical protein B0G83_11564 [Paraburkholderia sp. BL21I4N1]|nr:hypothetical protein B0G83_11564 [Paraburkholderia sp. BL21I4N1]